MAMKRKTRAEQEQHCPPILLEPTEDGDLAALGEALLDIALDILQRRPDLIQARKKADQGSTPEQDQGSGE